MNKRPPREHISTKSLLVLGVPKEFTTKTLDDYVANNDNLKKVKKFVKDYINNIDENVENNKGIMFYGSNGVGKTFLASMILKECYRKRYHTRRVTFARYIELHTSGWNNQEITSDTTYETFMGAEVLCLEEIGKEVDSKIAKPFLEELLRYREEQGLLTIICTNARLDVLEELYGKSVSSIIKGLCTPVRIVGEDKRGN